MKSWKNAVLAVGREMVLNLSNVQSGHLKLGNTVKQYLHLADIDKNISSREGTILGDAFLTASAAF